MQYKDYYKILGVRKNCSQSDIKKAFRELAKTYHPDRNKGNKTAEAKFKEVNEAYEVLKDPEKRKKYDTLGANWKQYQNGGGGGNPFGNMNDIFGKNSPFSDFFNQFFGGGGGNPFGDLMGDAQTRQTARKGKNLSAQLHITLSEAHQGTERILHLNKGSKLKVKIKPGVANGQKLRLVGKGQPSYGGKSGDLIVTVNIAEHPQYERKGADLYADLPVDVFTLILGGKTNFKAFNGTLSLPIKAGTNGGKRLRLKGKGMPVYDKNVRGDLYLTIRAMVPNNLNAEQMELVKKLADNKH